MAPDQTAYPTHTPHTPHVADATGTTPTGPKRRRLGRGLSGLIGDPVTVSTTNTHAVSHGAPAAPHARPPAEPHAELGQNGQKDHGSEASSAREGLQADRIIHVPVGSVVPNRFQPRSDFESQGLAELAASIRSEGIMQPILVRPSSGGGATGGRYELIAGERRWRAAKLAGLEAVPAIVRELSDESSAEWALIENIHRQDLNAMERAEAMASLLSRFGMSQTALAEKLGLERPTVANLVRLVELEPAIRELIAGGRLGAGHGKALLSLPEGDARVDLAARAAQEAWSVRRLEAEARSALKPSSKPNIDQHSLSQREAVLGSLERRLSDHLGTKVHIKTKGGSGKGRIEIGFFSADHFEGLVRALGIEDPGA